MPRRFLIGAALIGVFLTCSPVWAARSELIPETAVAQHGLTRPWFAQVELDEGRGNLNSVLLNEGVLYAQTSSAMLHAIDAETGKTLWSKQVGLAKHPSLPPDARGDLVATINGSRLYVLNRFNGVLLCDKEIQDAPGGGPAISSKRIYVPIVTGLIVAYPNESLINKKTASISAVTDAAAADKTKTVAIPKEGDPVRKKDAAPIHCQSFGRALVQPLVTRDDVGGEYVVWPTDRGYLNFGRISREMENSFVVKYRLETGATIVARPAYLPPDPKSLGDAGVVFAASCDGFLYAIQEETGGTLWRFSTGEPIVKSPAVIDDRVYVATQLGSMYCIDVKTGQSVWRANDVMQFVAATKARVYVLDKIGRLVVLNAASGAKLDAMSVGRVSSILANSDTDRIYLISEGGLIQCLRETEQNQPLMHNKERKDAAKAALIATEEPKKETVVEKPAKKEHVAPKAPVEPKDKPVVTKKKTEPKVPRKGGKKAAADLGGGEGDAASPFDEGVPKKGAKASKKKASKKKGDDPF